MEIHYFAAARAAAGTDRQLIDPPTGTLDDLLRELAAHHTGTTDAGMNLGDIFDRCTFLVDGHNTPRHAPLTGAHRIDVLPPFAGG